MQVLNELANVMARKLKLDRTAADEILAMVRGLSEVVPLTVDVHLAGLQIAARYGYPVHDSMIIAAATDAGCEVVWSEDMQAGQRIGPVTLRNPFQR